MGRGPCVGHSLAGPIQAVFRLQAIAREVTEVKLTGSVRFQRVRQNSYELSADDLMS